VFGKLHGLTRRLGTSRPYLPERGARTRREGARARGREGVGAWGRGARARGREGAGARGRGGAGARGREGAWRGRWEVGRFVPKRCRWVLGFVAGVDSSVSSMASRGGWGPAGPTCRSVARRGGWGPAGAYLPALPADAWRGAYLTVWPPISNLSCDQRS
jgi:hypothetical protein